MKFTDNTTKSSCSLTTYEPHKICEYFDNPKKQLHNSCKLVFNTSL